LSANFPSPSVPPVTWQSPPTQISPTDAGFTPGLLSIETDFNGAAQTTQFADTHATTADQFVAQLAAIAAQVIPPVINPVFPTGPTAPPISVPAIPATVPIVYTPPSIPAAFTGSLTVSDTFPDFTAGPPQLLFPNVPAGLTAVLPGTPTVDLNFVYPTVEVTLPTPPDLLSLTTYQFNGITMPTLNATAPVLTLTAPQNMPYLINAPYTDALLSELQTVLQDRIQNGTNTGLPAAVEENLWNRAREREIRTAADSIAALDRLESMGYSLPSGAWLDAQIKIQNELGYAAFGLEREVAIKQAELIHDDIVKALDTSVAIETQLIQYQNAREQREFEGWKYGIQAGIDIYNAQVQAFAQMVNVYRATIEVYNAQIQGQLAYVQAYKVEIDAEMVKAQINEALVNEYKVQVDAALASIEVFKGEIDIVKTQAEVEQIKVSIFGEEVRAYTSQVEAYTATINAYKAQIDAEGAKEQVFATQAQVYKTQVDAQVAEINAQVDVFKALLAEKTEEYNAYTAQVQGQAEQVKALAAQNQSIAAIYSAEVQGQASYNEAIVKEYQVALDEAVQITQIGVQAAQANVQAYLTARQILTDAAKVGAQVEAQIAASALGAVTYATHRSRQDSVSYSEGNSRSDSTSNSVSYSVQNSSSESGTATDSLQDQQAVSTSVNTNYNISTAD